MHKTNKAADYGYHRTPPGGSFRWQSNTVAFVRLWCNITARYYLLLLLAREAALRQPAISWSGRRDQHKRELVSVRTKDGRDVGEAMTSEGLAQPWPNQGNVWCGR